MSSLSHDSPSVPLGYQRIHKGSHSTHVPWFFLWFMSWRRKDCNPEARLRLSTLLAWVTFLDIGPPNGGHQS